MSLEEPNTEVLSGDVLPAKRANPNLTPAQLQAAVAEASGASRADIAVLAGVSESAIKQWRQKPEYQGEVERLRLSHAEAIVEPVRRMREELITGTTDAIKTLRDNLQAVDTKGRPAYGIRQKAAETLIQHGIDLDRETRAQASGGAAPAANQAIVVVLKDGKDDD